MSKGDRGVGDSPTKTNSRLQNTLLDNFKIGVSPSDVDKITLKQKISGVVMSLIINGVPDKRVDDGVQENPLRP